VSERRRISVGVLQQPQEVVNEVGNVTVNNDDSELSDDDQCLHEDGSKLQHHSPLHENLLTKMTLRIIENKDCHLNHNGS